MSDLSTTVDGLKLPNPLVIASGPPGTNANVIGKAFDEGWGAVICKTISLDASKVVNVQPRYARLRAADSQEIIGWENIELISDRSFDIWIEEFKQIKDRHPDGVLIASIMEEYRKDAWIEIVERCQEAGVDAFECNFSCPHGLPERRMGSAMGENPEILEEVCRWVMGAAKVPVWAKMTPNVTHIEDPSMCVTFGVIFAHTGTLAAPMTQRQTSSRISGFSPIAEPMRRSGRPCGQEKLHSKASTPASWQRSTISIHASLRYSSMIEAIRTPSGCRSLICLNSSIQMSKERSLMSSMFSQ